MDPEEFSSQKTECNIETYRFLGPPCDAGEIGRLAHFRVLSALGMGGMGIVFRAEDIRLQRIVALKVMRPEMAAIPEAATRFLREGRAMASVRHDHVATVYEAGEDLGIPFLAMELLNGCTLHEWLSKRDSASIAEAVEIGLGVALGLAAAHSRGLVHRDIKPSNVFLELPDGRIKILDFGLARTLDSGSGVTGIGALVGTPQYMSPEQVNGEAVDFRSDLFGLGCILHQLCTGRVPFLGRTSIAILQAIALQEVPAMRTSKPALPAKIDELVIRLLAKNPAARPNSTVEVVETLQSIRQELLAAGDSTQVGQLTQVDVETPRAWSTISLDKSVASGRKQLGLRRLRSTLSRHAWQRSATIIGVILISSLAYWLVYSPNASSPRQWWYDDLGSPLDAWRVFVEGEPKWELAQLDEERDGRPVTQFTLAGGTPYSNAHFYRNLPSTGEDGRKRFTLDVSFSFSPMTRKNDSRELAPQGRVESTIQAIEFTANEWRKGFRSELALQWQNVGPNAPCWRYWDPHAQSDRWCELGISASLDAENWHTLRLIGVVEDQRVIYEHFAIDGRTHKLGIVVSAIETPDEPDKVAVGIQLDGNAHADSYKVDLDQINLTIRRE